MKKSSLYQYSNRLCSIGGLFSIVLGLGSFGSQPAAAFISPDEFAADDGHIATHQPSAAMGFKPVKEKQVIRVMRSKSHEQFTINGEKQAEIFVDQLDGSKVLRRGELGLSLDQILLPNGRSVLQALSVPSSRKTAEELIAKNLITALQADSATSFQGQKLELNRERSYLGQDFQSLSFELYRNGRRIEGTELTARFRHGEWVSWTSESFGALEDRAEVLTAALKVDLNRVAQESLGAEFAKFVSKESIYMPVVQENKYQLVPAQRAVALDKAGQTYTLTVSEIDGSVIEFFANRYHFEGQISGTYYSRHPESPALTSGMPFVQVKTGGVFDRQTHTADRDGNLTVPDASEVIVRLVSPFVRVGNSSGNAAQMPATGDAAFIPGENSSFAETTTYFHTNIVNEFVRSRLDTKLDWLDEQLVATVNISSVCNAFYNGSLNFFQSGSRTGRDGTELSCNNTGEIADVVYHEWGHGLDDNTGGIDDGAFSEGIGDIVSMLITGSPEVGPYFMTNGSPVRNLDGDYRYPPAPDMREVHKEGLIIGSTWYHLTEALKQKYGPEVGRDTSARLFLKVIYSASRYEGAYDAAVDIDSENGEQGPNFCLINAAFARHGLAETDSRCES